MVFASDFARENDKKKTSENARKRYSVHVYSLCLMKITPHIRKYVKEANKSLTQAVAKPAWLFGHAMQILIIIIHFFRNSLF